MSLYTSQKTVKQTMELLALHVKAIRKEKKWSQKVLAEKSDVAYASLRKFESSGIISLESLLKLCKALGRLEEFSTLLQPHNLQSKNNLFDI